MATSATATVSSPGSNYYGASPWVRALRLGLGASQRIWPTFGVRAAYRLFGTPLPPKWMNPRHGPDSHWSREDWPYENASINVYTPVVNPMDAPLVLLVHGWGGHAG